MNLTAFDGISFSSLGVTCTLDPVSPGPNRRIPSDPRMGADPIAPGVEQDVHVITGLFTSKAGATEYVEINLSKLLAVLNPDNEKPRVLTGTILTTGPSTYTTVQTIAHVGNWRYRGNNQIEVEFILTSPGWKAPSPTTLKSAGTINADSNFANLNTGLRDVAPLITLYWPGVAQRTNPIAEFGWRARIGSGTTITNIGTEPLRNQPYQIGPIDTKTLVAAGKMQASGVDLRVFCEGQELRRDVIGPNTLATLIWIILPDLMPGQSILLEIVTSNNISTSAPTFSYTSDPPRPAMDISGQSFSPTSSAATTATLTGAGWEVDQWAGATVLLMRSAGAGFEQLRRVISNTATTITVDRAWTGLPGGSDTLTITKSGITGTGGVVTSGTTTTMTDTGQAWNANEWIGATFKNLNTGATSTVTGNTATVLTFSPAITAPVNPHAYTLWRANGQRVWDVRTVKKVTVYNGLWGTNKSETPPSGINFDAAGAWYRFAYQRSRDAYSQPRYTSYLIGGSDYDHFPVMNIQRARDGRAQAQKEVGVADAIGVASPFPINGIEFAYAIQNAKMAGSSPAAGMAEARFMSQDAGGETWATFLSDTAVNTALTNVAQAWYNLSASSPNRIAMALVPNGTDEILDTDNNTARLTTNGNYWRLAVNPTAAITESVVWFTATPAAVDVYDIDLKIRRGGNSAVRPYYRIRIGGPGRRVFLASTSERILVDCERHAVELVDASGNYIRSIAYAAVAQEVIIGSDGIERILVAGRWLPIPPQAVDSAAIYYRDDSGAPWGTLNLGVTGTLGYWT